MAIYYTPRVHGFLDLAQKKGAFFAEIAATATAGGATAAKSASDMATQITAINTILKNYLMEATA